MEAAAPSATYTAVVPSAVATLAALLVLVLLAHPAVGTLDGEVTPPHAAYASALHGEYHLMNITLNNGTGANWTNEVTTITVTFESITAFDMVAQVPYIRVYRETGASDGYDAGDALVAQTFPADKAGGPTFFTWSLHLAGLFVPSQPGNATVYLVINDTSQLADASQFRATINKDDVESTYGTLPLSNVPPGITVTVDNVLPKALMSADLGPVVNIGTTVTFTSQSSDNNTVVWRGWDFNNDTVVDATGPSVPHQFNTPGTFDIWHYVRDAASLTNSTHHTITVVDNVAPVAAFVLSPLSPFDEDVSVAFNASGSSDNVGVVNYTWDFEDDGTPDAYGVASSHAFSQPGTYTVRLTVRDAAGNADAQTHPAVVRDVTSPSASISVAPSLSIDEDDSVILSANASTDNVGIVSYSWDVDGDGTVDMSGIWASAPYADPGVYQIVLNVTDAAGNWAVDQVALAVHDTTPPQASFTVSSGLSFNEDVQVTLASTSTDNNGTAGLNHSWDFDGDGDGDVFTPSVLYTQPNPGQFNVTLTVTDAEGNPDSVTVTLTVNDVTDPEAVIYTSWGAVTDEDEMVAFQSTGTTDNGIIVNYTWDFDGDAEADAYGASASWVFPDPGTHTVSLIVTDSGGNADDATLAVTVEDVTPPTGAVDSLSMTPVISPGISNLYFAGTLVADMSASDNVGVATVCLYYDSPVALERHLGNATAPPYYVYFDSTDVPDGHHTLFAVIWDAAGNSYQTAGLDFIVDNTAPVLDYDLLGGWFQSGTFLYFGNASTLDLIANDPGCGLSSVEVRMGATVVDGNVTLGNNITASYTLEGVEVPLGATTLTLRAADRLGNTASVPLSNLRLDNTAPEVVLTHVDSAGAEAQIDPDSLPADGLVINVLDAFIANATDGGSGVASIRVEVAYPIPQTMTVQPGASFRIHLGASAIAFSAVDFLGNEGDVFTVPLSYDFYGGMEVETDMMLFGWTEPSGGGHLTWTLTGDLALDLRNLIVEHYDRDLPGQPGYRRIDEDEANDYLTDVEQSRATPSLENPFPDALDRRLGYWGARTNKYDLLYGNSDQGHDLRQSVTGMVDSNFDDSGPISIYFIFNGDYLAGRQFPKLVEEYLVNVLFSPFGLGYEYDGPVTYSHNEIIVGLPAFYDPDVSTGTAFVLRTPIGEVVWYKAEYSGETPSDAMETRDFDFVESPVVLFGFTLVGAYMTSYLPGRFFAGLREKMPRRLRMRAKRIKLLHAAAVMLILVLVAVYLVPTPFTLLGSNFFFSGYIIIILAVLFPTVIGVTAYLLYKKKYEELTGVTKPAAPDGEQQQEAAESPTSVPAYYDEAYAAPTAPPPAVLQDRQPLPNCGICLGSIEKGMSSMNCNCGAQFHYPCIRRIGDCPVCGTNIFPKPEHPSPPAEQQPATYTAPAPVKPLVQPPTSPEPAPTQEPEKPAPPAMSKAVCVICKNEFEHPEGVDHLRVRCPSCGTILKQIDRGFNHIVLSEKPGPALEMFVALTRARVPGMAITSTFPTKIQRQFKLEKDTIVYWLTNTANAQNMLDPKRLDFETTRAISNFVKNNKGPVILIDGLEYLIIENGFEKILKFIKKINDIASVNEATLIVALNPGSLPLDQATTLKKEFDKAHVVDDYDEPKFD